MLSSTYNKPWRPSSGIALLFSFNLGAKVGVSGQPYSPAALPRQRDPVPILQEIAFQGRNGTVRFILLSPELDHRTVQPVASSYNDWAISTHWKKGFFPPFWRNSPQWAKASSFTRFLDQKQRRTTVSRTPLDEWSARRRDLCLKTHNTHNRQTSIPPAGFELAISASERPQDRAVTRIAVKEVIVIEYQSNTVDTTIIMPTVD